MLLEGSLIFFAIVTEYNEHETQIKDNVQTAVGEPVYPVLFFCFQSLN
jgi:hypothetical protein